MDDAEQYGRAVTLVSLVQVLFWEEGSEQSEAESLRVVGTTALLSGLKGSTAYVISVRAQNSAGLGPCSPAFNYTTKKPRESTHKSHWLRLSPVSTGCEASSAETTQVKSKDFS